MSWKKTFLFFLAAFALAGFYYVTVRLPSGSIGLLPFSSRLTQARVLGLPEGDVINRIHLLNPSEGVDVTVRKVSETRWQIQKPVDDPAESLVMEGLTSLLRLTPRTRELSLDGQALRETGLAEPRLTVCAATENHSAERCLDIGGDAALIEGAYARWKDESKYFLVNSNFAAAFDKTLYSLRKKQIFSLLEADVRSLSVQTAAGGYELVHEGKNWSLQKPIEAALGTESSHELLTSLNDLHAKEFLDSENWNDPKLGLTPKSNFIKIDFQNQSEQKLIFGAEAPGRDAYFARTGDDETVLLISKRRLEKIEDTLRALTS